jgi:hypothetical protein
MPYLCPTKALFASAGVQLAQIPGATVHGSSSASTTYMARRPPLIPSLSPRPCRLGMTGGDGHRTRQQGWGCVARSTIAWEHDTRAPAALRPGPSPATSTAVPLSATSPRTAPRGYRPGPRNPSTPAWNTWTTARTSRARSRGTTGGIQLSSPLLPPMFSRQSFHRCCLAESFRRCRISPRVSAYVVSPRVV